MNTHTTHTNINSSVGASIARPCSATILSKHKTKQVLISLLILIFVTSTIISSINIGLFNNNSNKTLNAFADTGQASGNGTTIETYVRTKYTDLATGINDYIPASDIPSFSQTNNYGDPLSRLEPNHLIGHRISDANSNVNCSIYVRLDVKWFESTTSDKIVFEAPYAATGIVKGTDTSTNAYVANMSLGNRPATLSGTKDNHKIATITLTNTAIAQGTEFCIFYEIRFQGSESAYSYDGDTADMTPRLTLGGTPNAAIGEALRVTIAMKSDIIPTIKKNGEGAQVSTSPGAFYSNMATNSAVSTAPKAKIGEIKNLVASTYLLLIDNSNDPVKYMNGELPSLNAKMTITFPAGVILSPLHSLSAPWTIDTSGPTTVITYTQSYNSNTIQTPGFFVKYIAPPTNGEFYEYSVKMDGTYRDGRSYSYTNISKEVYDPVPLTSGMAIYAYNTCQNLPANPGLDGGEYASHNYNYNSKHLALNDWTMPKVRVDNDKQTALEDVIASIIVDGDKLNYGWLAITNFTGATNPYQFSGKIAEIFDNVTIHYSNGDTRVIPMTDTSIWINENPTVQTMPSLNNTRVLSNPSGVGSWFMDGQAANVYIKQVDLKMKKALMPGQSFMFDFSTQLRETYRSNGQPIIPTNAGFATSDKFRTTAYAIATPELGIAPITKQAVTTAVDIYQTTMDIPALGELKRAGNELPSSLSGGQTIAKVITFGCMALTNTYYNAWVRNPELKIIIPDYLVFDPSSFTAKMTTGYTPALDGKYSGILQTQGALILGADYTLTHEFLQAPGEQSVNVYTLRYLGDLHCLKNFSITCTYNFTIPLGTPARDDGNVKYSIFAEDRQGKLYSTPSETAKDIYDLDHNGITNQSINLATSTFRIIVPSIFGSNLASHGDLGGSWAMDAWNFSDINSLNLAKVKSSGSLRYRLANNVATPKTGKDAYIKLADGAFKPTLTALILTDTVGSTTTTRASLGTVKYTTANTNDPKGLSAGSWTTLAGGNVSNLPQNATWVKLEGLGVNANTTLDVLADYAIPAGLNHGDTARGLAFTDMSGTDSFSNYAGFVVDTYKVNYDLNGATTPTSISPILQALWTDSSLIPSVIPEKAGYTFKGWDVSAGGKNPAATNVLNTATYGALAGSSTAPSITLKASFEAIAYNITYAGINGASLTSKPLTYSALTSRPLVVSNPTKDYYTFSGWTVEYWNANTSSWVAEPGKTSNYLVPDDKHTDIRLTASWTANGYEITYSGINGANMTQKPEAYNTDTARPIIVSNPTKDHYTFLGWSVDYTNPSLTDITAPSMWVTNYAITTGINSDIKLTAHFEADRYNITYRGLGSADTTPYPANYTVETSRPINIPNPIRDGFTFLGWTVEYTDPSLTDITEPALWAMDYTIPADALTNIRLTANWSPFVIDYVLNGGEIATNAPILYNEADTSDSSITIPDAYGKYGYIFRGWTVEYLRYGYDIYDETVPTLDYHIPQGMLSSVVLTANWTKDPSINFTLTYDGNGHTAGTAPADITVYLMDDEAIVLGKGDLVKTDWTFIGWSTVPTATATDFAENDELVLYTEGDELAITADTVLYAIWQKNPPAPPTKPEDKPTKPENPGTTDPTKPGNGNGGNGAGIVDNNSNNGDNSSRGNGATNTNGNGVGAHTARPNENGTTEPTDAPNNTNPATITDNQTPLSNGQADNNWSLLSLLLGITSVLISLMFMLIRRRKDEDEYVDAEHKNRSVLKLTAVLLGIVPIVLFLILDDLTAPMTFVNRYTVFVAIAFVAHCFTTVIAKTRQDKETENSYDYMG